MADLCIGFREILIFFVLVLLVALIKPPFIMFAVLLLLIPKSKFKSKKDYKISWIVLILLFLTILLVNMLYSIPQLNNSFRYDNYVYYGINAKSQLLFMLNNPIKSIMMMTSPIYLNISFISLFHLGDIMTTDVASFNSDLLIFLFAVYYFILLIYSKTDLKIKNIIKFGSFMVSMIIYFGVLFAVYLTWTPVGSNIVEGLQGRYFLPLLTLLPLGVTSNNFSFLKDKEKEMDLLFVVLMIVFLSSVFILLIYFYYMSGQYGGMSIPNTSNIF
jgi:uncharacterized membrane protein